MKWKARNYSLDFFRHIGRICNGKGPRVPPPFHRILVVPTAAIVILRILVSNFIKIKQIDNYCGFLFWHAIFFCGAKTGSNYKQFLKCHVTKVHFVKLLTAILINLPYDWFHYRSFYLISIIIIKVVIFSQIGLSH